MGPFQKSPIPPSKHTVGKLTVKDVVLSYHLLGMTVWQPGCGLKRAFYSPFYHIQQQLVMMRAKFAFQVPGLFGYT
jgi:hypothetical protein